jgi:hypothetical protein
MTVAPVFIVGCGRSGTTLLRLMLAGHPSLAIPPESHFIYEIARRRATGRWPSNLEGEGSWLQLISYLEQHPFLDTWGISIESLKERLNELPDRSHSSVFEAVFREYAGEQCKPGWGDKTPMHVQYMLVLDELFPTARFIHVIRDGRDVALSLLTRQWGPRYVSLAGYYWKWLVLSGKVAGNLLGPSRYREVRFEELVDDTEGSLRSLCNWLDLTYTNELLSYFEGDAARDYAKTGGVSQRLVTPPDRGRLDRWKLEMTKADQRSLLSQAGALLAECGYEADPLGPRQQCERNALTRLMASETIERLDRSALPRVGPAGLLPVRLTLDRIAQFGNFGRGRFEDWARYGICWQRSVAAMLD